MNVDESVNIGPRPLVPAPMYGLHGDLRQLAAQGVDLGLLLGDLLLGGGDLGVEAVLLVDGRDVVLGEDVGALLEPLELVGDLLDPRPAGRRSEWRRRSDGHGGEHGHGDAPRR